MNKMTISAEEVIQAIRLLNGINGLVTIKNDFYYDETNNYRKVSLRDSKLSFEGDGDFVLGGIVADSGKTIDLDELYKLIKLDKSANEMKFKHVAKGDLVTILNSKKLRAVLEFILQNGMHVHLQRVNVLYWSVIDIIESVIVAHREEVIVINHFYLKDLFYRILIQKKDETLSLFKEFAYPDVDGNSLSLFYGRLIELAKPKITSRNSLDQLLTQVLEFGRELKEAVFIQNEQRGMLLDDFSHFYRHRALMFPNSHHYFDAEMQIEEKLRASENSYKAKILNNYSFVDSKHNPGIQLADVVVGYFAKLFNFCKGRSPVELIAIRGSLNKNQLELLRLSRTLIDRTDAQNAAYFHYIVPVSDGGTWAELVH